jgi:flagellar hook-associated protein 2
MSSVSRLFGLSGSGLDIDKIVTDLMKAERMKQDKIKQNKQIAEWQKSDYRELNNSLRALRDSAFNMKLQGTFLGKKATSSNEGIVRVTANNSAVAGINTLKVTQLAANARLNSSEKVAFDSTGKTLEEQLGLAAGTITFTVNGSETITIDTSVDTIDTLVSKINGAKKADGSSAGVSAVFDKTLCRMFISSTATGAEAQVSFNVGTAADLFARLNLDTSQPQYGTNARIILNGLSLEEASNQFTIAGVTYTLTGVSDTETVNITLASDTDGIYDTIKSFVDLYNATIDKLYTKLNEERNKNYLPLTDDQREKLSDKQQERWEEIAKTGLLRNDSLLMGIVSNMRNSMASVVSGVDEKYNCLADLGITTGSYYENGKLVINEEKLKDAINKNPQAVMELFTNSSDVAGEKGLASRLYDNLTDGINQIIDKAGVDSTYSLVDNSVLGKKIHDYDKQIADWDERLKVIENRYYKQYAALETALSQLNQQSYSIMSLLGTNK